MVRNKPKKGRVALLVEGARRIGKSYIVEDFCQRGIRKLPSHQLQSGAPNAEARTLIIFNEVQFCPRAREVIKYLVANRRFDYIETGSLISIKKNVKDILIP